MKDRNLLLAITLGTFICLLKLLSLHHPFFWDTIQLSSKQAHWFFDHHFRYFLLPDEIDSGHIPLMGIYLASVWEVFGRSLPVSHLAMMPFLIGIVWQTYLLLRKLVTPDLLPFALLIFFLDPTLLSQMSLVSPDLILVFAFLLSLNSIVSGRRFLLIMGILLLSLISLRGLMASCALLLLEFLTEWLWNKKTSTFRIFQRTLFPFLPGFFIAGAYLAWHYWNKNWIGYHSDSPWMGSFRHTSVPEALRNLLIAAWRLIDFGRIAWWIILMWLIMKFFREKRKLTRQSFQLISLLILLTLIFIPITILHRNLSAHRYFLPITLTAFLLTSHLVGTVAIPKSKIYLGTLLISFSLIAGNVLHYPYGISTGWDATLAHWPWYNLSRQMDSYIRDKKIASTQVGTCFPNLNPFRFTYLNNDSSGYAQVYLGKNEYVYWSNLMNDFPEKEFTIVQKSWPLEKECRRGGIQVRLYRNPYLSLPLEKSFPHE